MSFKTKVNIIRKRATKLVTKSLQDQEDIRFTKQHHIKRILITRPNHRLGNQLLITPLVKEVQEQFPEAKIDLFLKGNLGKMIFKNYDNVDYIICLPKKHFKELGKYILSWFKLRRKHYDLVINAEATSSSGRLSTKIARSKCKFFGYPKESNTIKTKGVEHISKYPIYSLRYYLKQNLKDNPVPGLEIKLSEEELQEGKRLLAEYADLDRPTLCLYTFATGDKCFSKAWWKNFYDALKKEYPNHNIIEVLPVENVSSLDFKIPAFYSKSIREMASFITHASVFITGDCGIMHLAAATQTPTIGLFNVTNKDMYEPYNKACLGIDTNDKDAKEICDILKAEISC